MRVHISLPVTDIEKSRTFYSTLFNQPVSKERDDYINFRLDEPAIHLSLIKSSAESARGGCEHYGIELPSAEAFESWEHRLTEVVPELARPEPGAKCCYAQADKVWLTDPDGHRWEIWHRTGEHDSLG